MPDDFGLGLMATVDVGVVASAVVAVHVAILHAGALRGSRVSTGDAVLLAGVAAVGAIAVWTWNGQLAAPANSWTFRAGAVALYAACLIVYIESRSLLSRGYSVRILVDLLRAGGASSVTGLKETYGGGKGIEGLLRKRIASLERLQLLRCEAQLIGPMTFGGRACAVAAHGMRRLLRLDMVG